MRQRRALAAAIGFVALVVGLPWPQARGQGPSTVVQVIGEVPSPGWYAVDEPTVGSALQAAGVRGAAAEEPVLPGDRVVVAGGVARVEASGREPLFGRPLDLQTVTAQDLARLPGVGTALARRVIEARDVRPIEDVAALDAVPGVGPRALTTLRPYLDLPEAPAGPVDLNTATPAALDALPGIGPALAQRIVEWRDARGGFPNVDALDEVSGIGPATVERLRPLVVASRP